MSDGELRRRIAMCVGRTRGFADLGPLADGARRHYPNIVISSIHPGVVATEFGTNALHGGMDSRQFPGAQPAEEVASIIADVIELPRSDV